MAELVEGKTATFLIHLFPRSLFEGGGGGAHLGDNTKGVILHVFHHITYCARRVFIRAVVADVVECVTEMTVLVIKEQKVDGVVCNFGGFFHRDGE